MTVVASFTVKSHPIIVGDLMISNEMIPKRLAKPFNIPTAVDVNRLIPITVWNTVSGLKQKVVVINKNIALAWAGNLNDAAKIIANVNQKAAKEDLSLDKILNFLETQREEVDDILYLTGVLTDDVKRAVARFAWRSDKGFDTKSYNNELLGEIYVDGTGKDDFLAIAGRLHGNVRSSSTGNTLESAICLSLSMAGQLTGQQMRLGTGLTNFYGGGYELVTLENGELKK